MRVQSEPHGSGNLSLWQDRAAIRWYTTPGPDLLPQPLIYHTDDLEVHVDVSHRVHAGVGNVAHHVSE
jgi:hypothetical protein